jgi:hypothetical protein
MHCSVSFLGRKVAGPTFGAFPRQTHHHNSAGVRTIRRPLSAAICRTLPAGIAPEPVIDCLAANFCNRLHRPGRSISAPSAMSRNVPLSAIPTLTQVSPQPVSSAAPIRCPGPGLLPACPAPTSGHPGATAGLLPPRRVDDGDVRPLGKETQFEPAAPLQPVANSPWSEV